MNDESSNPSMLENPAAPIRPWLLFVATATCLSCAFLVQRPYFSVGHSDDDLMHLSLLAQVQQGKSSLFRFLFEPHFEHWLPLWRVWYFLCWRLFGLNPLPWHLTITLSHALSGVLLYVVLRRYVANELACWSAALFWSSAALGRWDNPLVWIAASHLVFAVTWILAASACVAHYHSPRSWLWRVGLAVCVAGAELTMSAMLLVSLSLPLQYWFLERRANDRRREQWMWLSAWSAPTAIVGAILAFWVWPQSSNPDAVGGTVKIATVLHLDVALHATAMENLFFFWPPDRPVSIEPSLLAWSAFVAALCGLLWLREPASRLLGLIAGVSFAYTLLICAARSRWSPPIILTWSRYRYFPTLAWCVAVAAFFQAFAAVKGPAKERWLFTVLLLLAPLFVYRQAALAKATADQFVARERQEEPILKAGRGWLTVVDAELKKRGGRLELPDAPVLAKGVLRWSELAALTLPSGRSSIQFEDASSQESKARARQTLSELREPTPASISAALWDGNADGNEPR